MNERKNLTARVYTVSRLMLISLALAIAGCGTPEKSWDMAEREDTQTGYLEFLAKYPDGEFADRARHRIAELEEIRDWERAEFRDRRENYARFISLHPRSDRVTQARQRMLELDRDDAWEAVADTDTAQALQAFLDQYPNAPQRPEAEARLADLLAMEAEPPPPVEPPGDFRAQLGAFRTRQGAQTEAKRLSGLFAEVLAGPIDIVPPDTGRWFLLYSAPMSRVAAEQTCKLLKQARQDCLVSKRPLDD